MTTKKTLNDADMEQVTKSTADELKAQKKVKVKIHLPAQRKKELEAQVEAGKKVDWPFHTVGINGYNYQIQLGKEVEVPESVAAILEEAGLI